MYVISLPLLIMVFAGEAFTVWEPSVDELALTTIAIEDYIHQEVPLRVRMHVEDRQKGSINIISSADIHSILASAAHDTQSGFSAG